MWPVLAGKQNASKSRRIPPVAFTFVVVALIVVVLAVGFIGLRRDWGSEAHAAVVQYILAVVGLAAGGIAFWNILETRDIREQNAQQIELLREQFSHSLMPYLDVMIFPEHIVRDLKTLAERLPRGEPEADHPQLNRVAAQVQYLLMHSFNEPVRYFVVIDNPLEKIALNVGCFMFDSERRIFFATGYAKDAIPPGTAASFIFKESDTMTANQVYDEIEALTHGKRLIFDNIESDDKKSFLALVYQSSDGVYYLRIESFEVTGESDLSTGILTDRTGYTGHRPLITRI